MNNIKPSQFISMLTLSDEYIEHIYSQGSCYQFALLLCKLYSNTEVCKMYIRISDKAHVITRIGMFYYDVTGMLNSKEIMQYTPLTPEMETECKEWSFSKRCLLQLKECDACGEPITYNN